MDQPIVAQPQDLSPQPVKAQPPVCPEVLSIRKSCTADGVGLSHYILMDTPKK